MHHVEYNNLKITKELEQDLNKETKIKKENIYIYIYIINNVKNAYNIHILLSNLHILARITIWLVAFRLVILHTYFSEIYTEPGIAMRVHFF